MQIVSALSADLAVDAGYAELCFDLVFGSFLSTRDGTLSANESTLRDNEVTRIDEQLAIGCGAEVDDAAIDGDDRFSAWRRIG